MKDLLKNPTPNPKEAFLAILFAFVITSIIAWLDVTIHDNFVLPDVVASGGDMSIGLPYWSALNGIFLFIGSILLFGRIIGGKFAGAKTNAMLIFVGFLWFFSAIILFYTGWLDYFYYVIKGESVPDTLHWLNNNGLFVIFQKLGDDPNMVEHSDLSALMFVGLVSLIGFWSWIIHHHKKGTLKKLNLI